LNLNKFLRIAIQRGELEWRQGGELWEQGRIHWKLFEAKKPGKGSYLYFSCICGMVIGVIVL